MPKSFWITHIIATVSEKNPHMLHLFPAKNESYHFGNAWLFTSAVFLLWVSCCKHCKASQKVSLNKNHLHILIWQKSGLPNHSKMVAPFAHCIWLAGEPGLHSDLKTKLRATNHQCCWFPGEKDPHCVGQGWVWTLVTQLTHRKTQGNSPY